MLLLSSFFHKTSFGFGWETADVLLQGVAEKMFYVAPLQRSKVPFVGNNVGVTDIELANICKEI